MAEKIRFAVIGCGMLARAMHIPNLARSSKAALHTCCDTSSEVLDQCRRQYPGIRTTRDYLEAIRDGEVDAICLATTPSLRLPVIAEAARAGKAVYCEKPLANTLQEMHQIRQVVKDSGIPFCVGHNRRCSPAMMDAHRIFRAHMKSPAACPWRFDREGPRRPRLPEDGKASMNVRINDDWYSWKAWVFDPSQSAQEAMLFEMTHFTDLCNWFLDARPEEVAAMRSGMLLSGVIIRYATGELATITMTGNGTFGYPKELYEFLGNGGIVVVDCMLEVRTAGIEGAPPLTKYPMLADRHPHVGAEGGLEGYLAKKRAACGEAAARGDGGLIFTAEPDKGHAHALDRFADEIRGKGPAVCGVDESVLATRVAFAAVLSARERRFVRMDEIGET